MTGINNYNNGEEKCAGFHNFGQKLMYFMIGGSIGAAIALLFAPKRGSELRGDIADLSAKGIDQTAAAANHLKQLTADYYKAAKETGSEVLDVVSAGMSVIKEEVSNDAEKIGSIVQTSAKRAVNSAKQVGSV
jgi:gas vesicle protein